MAAGPNSPPLRDRLRAALVEAMKSRDKTTVAVLRSTLGAIDNAEAVDESLAPHAGGSAIAGAVVGVGAGEVPRRDLDEATITEIVRAELLQLHAAADEYAAGGYQERADLLRAQAATLSTHLS